MKKYFKRFRYGILFLSIFCLSTSLSVKAENRQSTLDKVKITVSFIDIPLSNALETIGEKCNFGITFNDADIPVNKTVSYEASEVSAERVLIDILKDTGLDFRLRENHIIIFKNQEKSIQGIVRDGESGIPLMGATIDVPNTTIGTTTDFDGNFTLRLEAVPVDIRVSYIGYETKVIEVNRVADYLQITLTPNNEELKEVVVTALGISRDEKSLGYSVGTVSGNEMNESKQLNLTNALAGKVAGVRISNVSSDPASSSLITIRGASSINGSNQPLFVVDGIPISSNSQNAESSGEGFVDYGNTAMDISPDDIADITVLKGGAAALYGSRAANGVILITTRKGKYGKKGLGVSYNNSVKMDSPWLYPEFQNQFAAGSDMLAVDENGIPVATGTSTWGPRISPGVEAVQTLPGGETTIAQLKAYPNRYKDFFEVGYTMTNNVSVTGNYDKGSFRLSYTNLQNEGIVPGTNYKKNSFNLNSTYKVSDNLSVSAMANFSIASSDNRPTQGKSGESDNATEVVYRLTPNTNIKDYESYWEEGLEGLQQKTLDGGDNPYFTAYEQRNQFDRTRLFGKLQFNYKINDALSFQFRSGIDTYQEQRVTKRAFSSLEFPNGAYGNKLMGFTETNFDALFTYSPQLVGNFNATISVGANRMDQKHHFTRAFSGQLELPRYYNISNAAAGSVDNSDGHNNKRINSVYGLMQLVYGNYLFLDLSARNDWSSTLPQEHNSYFYPAASLGFVFSDALNLKSNVFSFGKLRMSWSEVGNDTSPYQLTNTYGFSDWGDLKLAQNNQSLKNNNLKPEKTRMVEFGFDMRWLNNRLGLDVAVYRSKTFNQIISLPIAQSSGGSSKVINAGEIQNQGLEITLNAVPVENDNFSWNLSANFSKNENKVNELYEDIESIQLGSTTGIYQRLYIGGAIGDFYDERTPLRVESGPHQGRFILEDGMFIRDNKWVKTGNSTPDFRMGMTNIFNYKNIRLAFTFDWSQGGEFYNYTAKNLMSDGRIAFTTNYRDPQSGGVNFDYGGMVRSDGAIIPGVIQNEDGTYSENDVALPAPYYYGEYWDYEEFHMSTATYVKLRELSIGYTFKDLSWAENFTIDLIGNDLISWFAYKTKRNRDGFVIGDYDKGYDPETQNYLSSSGPLGITQGVSAWQLPATRSIGIKLSANF